jgi:predicted nucleic acid-binding protein
MIVVADSSPLHYLILLEQAEIIRRLYGNVLIPDAVAAELRAAASPPTVTEWMLNHHSITSTSRSSGPSSANGWRSDGRRTATRG